MIRAEKALPPRDPATYSYSIAIEVLNARFNFPSATALNNGAVGECLAKVDNITLVSITTVSIRVGTDVYLDAV
jgi:hypothetical protein